MLQHFEEMLSGTRYLVCTYSNGPSAKGKGRFRVHIYRMNGSEVEKESFDAGFATGNETHVRLDLLAIKAGLEEIGLTRDPVVVLTRLEYIPLHMKNLRKFDFYKKGGRGKEAANADILREIASSLDPDDRIEWRFAERDYDTMVEEWKADKQLDSDIQRAEESNSC
ncbi:hypothetical protein [Stappia sp.]|uniref:hypothetical protein n=1 Tax=Stappia sp. TaxID=1870903 RepID=UPI003C7CAE59